MNLPGFTAEVSLYGNGWPYLGASGRSDGSDGQTVVPQWWWDVGCGAECRRRDRFCGLLFDERDCNADFAACIQGCSANPRPVR